MIKIRKAKLSDVFKIYSFCKNRSEKSKKEFNSRVLRRPYWFLPLILFKKMICYIALDNKEIVGITYITYLKGDSVGFIVKGGLVNDNFGIGVRGNYQNQGIGRQLMESILKGQKNIYLTVIEGNISAEKLYQSFGFQTVNKILSMKRA